MLKIPRNNQCPCGSGKKFKYCCIDKNFTFSADGEGVYRRMLPIDGKTQSILGRQAELFSRHFERDPSQDAPIFLSKYLYSEEDIQKQLLEAMCKAKADPAHIYAYKKTGYLLTEGQLDNYPGAAIEEWNKAIQEFYLLGGEPDENPEAQLFDTTLQALADEFESLIYALGLAADNYFNTPHLDATLPGPTSMMSVSQYQALCACRVHRTLRTIRVLQENRLSEDMLKLSRSIYESYLHMIIVQRDPNAIATLVDIVVGLRQGIFKYKEKNDGSKDKRIIVEVATGREFPKQVITSYKMAAASPYAEDVPFFDFFYSTTSELIHPSVFALDAYVSSHGLDPVKPHMHEEAIIFTACVAAMVVDWIPKMKDCPQQVANDCRTVVTRVQKKLMCLFELLEVWNERLSASNEEVNLLKARCSRLAHN